MRFKRVSVFAGLTVAMIAVGPNSPVLSETCPKPYVGFFAPFGAKDEDLQWRLYQDGGDYATVAVTPLDPGYLRRSERWIEGLRLGSHTQIGGNYVSYEEVARAAREHCANMRRRLR